MILSAGRRCIAEARDLLAVEAAYADVTAAFPDEYHPGEAGETDVTPSPGERPASRH
jgi:hypothetical protein